MTKPRSQTKAVTQKAEERGEPSRVTFSLKRGKGLSLIVGLALIAAILVAFWQVRNHEFVTFDDDEYVIDNSHVRSGLTSQGILWAFTATHASNWHPLTWVSHMLDCGLYGLNPGGHHVTSLIFHIASTLLLFLVLKLMTGAVWESGFVSVLFALHPLHVESVAWVAERKDVLSTFFWMLTMWAYLRYVKGPRVLRYLSVLVCYILGLMSKPMLVTLPFVMLLLDYWPLGRFHLGQGNAGVAFAREPTEWPDRRSTASHLVLEKIPFFVLAAASSVLTLFAQQKGGTVKSLEFFPLGVRMMNSLVSYTGYLWKMIWPGHLAVLYPYSDRFPLWQALGAGLLMVGVSILVARSWRRRPYLLVGWLWYLGTLVPVIGLVQVGMQAMADRYTYIPLVGPFVMIVWGVSDILRGWRYRKMAFAVFAGILFLVLLVVTRLQVQVWQNNITLFNHALEATANNFMIHNNLGVVLARQGKIDEATAHYAEALRIHPHFAEARNNMGSVLFRRGKIDEAIQEYSEALKIAPHYADAHINLGMALVRAGKIPEAIGHYTEALKINPEYPEAHNNLGLALARQGKMEEAAAHYEEALRLKPDYVDGHNNLGSLLAGQGKTQEAILHFTEVLRKKPDDLTAYANLSLALANQGKSPKEIGQFIGALGVKVDDARLRNDLAVALARQGKNQEAVAQFTEALQNRSDDVIAHNNLGIALARQGKNQEAVAHFTEALRIKPDNAEAHNNLGIVLARLGKFKEAIAHHREALRIKPNLPEAHYALGLAYWMNGNRESALEEYHILKTIHPGLANSLLQKISK